jgi:hypothetical protein
MEMRGQRTHEREGRGADNKAWAAPRILKSLSPTKTSYQNRRLHLFAYWSVLSVSLGLKDLSREIFIIQGSFSAQYIVPRHLGYLDPIILHASDRHPSGPDESSAPCRLLEDRDKEVEHEVEVGCETSHPRGAMATPRSMESPPREPASAPEGAHQSHNQRRRARARHRRETEAPQRQRREEAGPVASGLAVRTSPWTRAGAIRRERGTQSTRIECRNYGKLYVFSSMRTDRESP